MDDASSVGIVHCVADFPHQGGRVAGREGSVGEGLGKAAAGDVPHAEVLIAEVFAGLDLIRGMPANDPRFLIVFTDGEDINSAFKGDVVNQASQGLTNLRVFAIDYMPEPKIDPFLAAFATQNHGQARKAGTGADLLTLFKQFASRLDQYYVVTYEFPPPVVAAAAAKPAEAPTAAAPPPATPSATAEAPPTAAPTSAPAAPAPEGGHSWWLWLLLLIVLILIIYFIARKSDDEEKKK